MGGGSARRKENSHGGCGADFAGSSTVPMWMYNSADINPSW